MTRPTAVADLLVLDAPAEGRADYQKWLADLVGTIIFAKSGDDLKLFGDGRSFAAVLIHVDGHGVTERNAEHALRDLSGVPALVVSAEISQVRAVASRISGPLDYLPLPIVPELLRAKLRLFLDLRRALNVGAELVRERDALSALAGEHVHRGKNLLAIIQSISLRTVSDGRSIAEARTALLGRLRAIARAYQAVTACGRSGIELGDIVEAEFGEFFHRAVVSGPSVRLRRGVVQTFTLAVHELVTNSLSYGSLGAPDGAVAVGWTFFDYGDESYLEVDWAEYGGPTAVAPQRPGFGLSLITSLAGPSAPSPNFSFEAPGFACRMRLPQDMIAAD
jgi:two-component sensor histidine kinase